MQHLKRIVSFLQQYHGNDFTCAVATAKELADLGVSFVYKQKRKMFKNFYLITSRANERQWVQLKLLGQMTFYGFFDQAFQSLQKQLINTKHQYNNFDFLHNTLKSQSTSNDDKLKYCKDLDLVLQTPTSLDIDLYNEKLLFK
jgi:hypothetical protein